MSRENGDNQSMPYILSTLFFPAKDAQPLTTLQYSQQIPIRLRTETLRQQGIMHLDSLTASAVYASSKDLQEMIRRFKYGKQRRLAAPLCEYLFQALQTFPLCEDTILCPVPLHWSRRFARGFNQAALLAKNLSAVVDRPLIEVLRRTRPTGHQAWRSHDERRLAMHDAFMTITDVPSHVTLVDDVATTMSTLDACAEVLKNAGVEYVDAIVIALG